MSFALSNRFHRYTLPAGLALLTLVAGCSGDRPQRPQAAIGNADVIVPPQPAHEPRVVGLAEEIENNANGVTAQSQPHYAGDYGFTAPVENPVSTVENIYAMSNGEMACRTRLKRLGVVFTEKSPINQGGSCRIDNPIEVRGFNSGAIAFKPAATLNCEVTEAFARWIKGDLQPSARLRYLSGINTIHNAGGYSCRTMNHRRGAKMSEHSRGNAIDVTKIVLNNGKSITVRKPGFFAFREKGLLNSVRSDACSYFTTVLGPGYNREHADHFHFDLMQRRSGYRACK
ncbi:extensin family protein [Ochrobactrum sp. Marseille-Q0166]|uniref:extensin-like domain-containing protein n=1 Tax=Ochrobactrum sp. Marseille-Q0166 TaxID=2761105 RepID=UPI00165674E0|nr:extensin family protein [Ochrobactrum sp. Marseille-Q0166]MBC8717032.1 extensin family protein [Ochrobactrum sp. Marseille-Q0166]